jgi:putative transposase
MLKAEYPSDLGDLEWQLIKDVLPPARAFGRPRITNLREVVNAVFYVNRTGCAWRYLPRSFPPWKTVYDYFRQWRMSGLWKQMHDALVALVREKEGRSVNPSLLMLDSQSAKAQYGDARGYDGFKKVRGRKRQIVVDALGLIHGLKVHAANASDRTEGPSAVERCGRIERITGFIVDSGYAGYKFESQVYRRIKVWPTITSSKAKQTCIYDPKNQTCEYKKVLVASNLKPKRWIVERTFAWFNHYRRLSRDYERNSQVSETMIYLAMAQLMLRRLSKMQP